MAAAVQPNCLWNFQKTSFPLKKSSWSLRADPGQRLHLRFLDISLRERTSDGDLECADSVEVEESGKRLLRMCGESQTDIRLLSGRNVLEVLLTSLGKKAESAR